MGVDQPAIGVLGIAPHLVTLNFLDGVNRGSRLNQPPECEFKAGFEARTSERA
jgi:hypothetical protein